MAAPNIEISSPVTSVDGLGGTTLSTTSNVNMPAVSSGTLVFNTDMSTLFVSDGTSWYPVTVGNAVVF